MTSKTKTILAALASGLTGYLAYFIALPLSLQTGMLGDVIQLLPSAWQPVAAGTAKTLSVFLGFYATYHAAHSGPQTAPVSAADKTTNAAAPSTPVNPNDTVALPK